MMHPLSFLRSWDSVHSWQRLTCLSFLTVATLAGISSAIELQADFDHASLDLTNSFAMGPAVTLAGRDNHNPNRWKWIYFSASDVVGQSLQFRIDDDFATGGENLVGHEMVFSYDQQVWQFFDNNQRNAGAGTFTFWNDAPFTQPMVYVAYGFPYPLGRTINHTESIKQNQWVTSTASGNSDLVVGQSPGGLDDLGRLIPQHDLYGYQITDSIGAAQKAKVVLTSGVHANETLGNYVLEGLVDFLTGQDFDAALLRKYADFHVYPMINPDGRSAGYNRSTVANESQDPNRFWVPSSYGGIAEVGTMGSTMVSDSGGADYLIDFHSTVVGKSGHHGLVHPTMQADPFWQAVLTYEPEIETRNALLVDDTLAKFGRDHLGADFSMTFETQYRAGEDIARFLDIGTSFGLALAETLTVQADLDLNGELGLGDFQILMAYAESNLAGLSSVDAYLRGDLDRDGNNNIVDFGIFRDTYEAQAGEGSFARLLLQVPEPDFADRIPLTTLTILLIARFRNTTPPAISAGALRRISS